VDSRNFSDTLVWLNISEKYKQNFPENPKITASHKTQISLCQEIIETKKYRKLGGVNDCMRNPTSRRKRDGRKKEEGERENLYFCYVAEFSYFLSS